MERVKTRLLAGVMLWAAVALALSEASASANGDSVVFYRGVQGPFELMVGSQPASPVVGTVHLTLMVAASETSHPVAGARVDVVADDPKGRAAYQARAVSIPAFPNQYDTNLTIDSPGAWTLLVTVSRADLGEATFTVPLSVGEQSIGPGRGGTVVWLGLLAVLGGGATYVWYSARRRRATG